MAKIGEPKAKVNSTPRQCPFGQAQRVRPPRPPYPLRTTFKGYLLVVSKGIFSLHLEVFGVRFHTAWIVHGVSSPLVEFRISCSADEKLHFCNEVRPKDTISACNGTCSACCGGSGASATRARSLLRG